MATTRTINARDSAGRRFAQPRDDHGRFLGHNGKHNRKFTLDELKKAYKDGLNDSSRLLPPSRQLEFYLKKMGYENE